MQVFSHQYTEVGVQTVSRKLITDIPKHLQSYTDILNEKNLIINRTKKYILFSMK